MNEQKPQRNTGMMYGYSAISDKHGNALQVLRHDLKTGEQKVVYKHPNHTIINANIKQI